MRRLFPTACFAVLCFSPTGVPAESAADGLVAVWHFDEAKGSRVLDASGNGLDGRIMGAKRVAGLFGTAVECDGVHDHVALPGVGELQQGAVEAWVKLLKPTSGQTGFVTFGMGYGMRNDVAILGASPKMPKFQLAPSSFGICSGPWHTAQDAAGLKLAEWHHVVGTWGQKGLKFYCNGKLAAQDAEYTGPLPAHAAVLIGAGSWNSHTACLVDEVRIYSRALSADVIERHFASRAYVARPAQPTQSRRTLRKSAVADMADFYDPGDFTCGLQRAIDSLPTQGGVVTIPPGIYLLKRAIHVRSRVALRGAGPATILTRDAQARSPLVKTAAQGDRSVTLASADGFELGSEVGVKSRKQGGWYVTHAIITAIQGNVIELDRPLGKTYEVNDGAIVINHFPALSVAARSNVMIQDLCIDGNIEENAGPETDFTFEAIHFYNTSDSTIRHCVVRDWPSDGIGVQGGRNVKVIGCTVSGCRGHGYHPGTSLQHAVWNGNLGHHNRGDGLYFCASVQHIVVSDSVFHHNAGDGIGGLGGGGDRYNVVANNVCEANGQHGIDAAGGTENVIASNVCINNSQSKSGRFVGICLHDATRTTVTGNRCLDNQNKPTQLVGIRESGKSDHNLFATNHLVSDTGVGIEMVGPRSQQYGNLVGQGGKGKH